jgi:hypothetical protein
MSVEFYQTAMGRDFYERTMPGLVRELARLNALLEKLVAAPKGDRTPDLLDAMQTLSDEEAS